MRHAILLALLFLSGFAFAKAEYAPRVFSTDPDAARHFRDAVRAGDAGVAAAAAKARDDADRALKLAPVSVTSKEVTPPSGDKHDYLTLAPYWWPNPNTANGLPYIRRDGERNPEISKIQDHKYFDEVMSGSYALALGYYLTGDERYAQHAGELVLLRRLAATVEAFEGNEPAACRVFGHAGIITSCQLSVVSVRDSPSRRLPAGGLSVGGGYFFACIFAL